MHGQLFLGVWKSTVYLKIFFLKIVFGIDIYLSELKAVAKWCWASPKVWPERQFPKDTQNENRQYSETGLLR